MERAKHSECYVLVLAVVLLFSPQVGFARPMSGGASGVRGPSFSSIGSRHARVVFSGPRAFVPNPGSRAFIAARNPGRSFKPMIVGARAGARSAFFPGHQVNFSHRPRTFINRFGAPIIIAPYQPYFYPYCDSIYFRAYDCPAPYTPFAPVYVPVPVAAYSYENPYDVDNSVSLPADNRYYVPSNSAREPAAVSAESFDRQGDRAFRARDYITALRDWQHAVVDDPKNGGLAIKLGLAMFALESYREAAGSTQQALTLLPEEKWEEAFNDYRKLYASPADYANQLKTLAKASADKPNDPALRFLLGLHYGYSGRVADAARELDKLVQLQPRDQLGRKLRDVIAGKTRKNSTASTAASSGIYTRKDSNGTVYFSNVPADLKKQPTAWQRVPY